MGNCLVSIFSELEFGTKCKRSTKYIQRIDHNDILAIFGANLCNLDDFLVLLNSKFTTINFTIEKRIQ